MNFKGIELCCPQCRGDLERPGAAEILCRGCGRRFPVVLDIPDLRLEPDPYIGFEEEHAKIEKLVVRFAELDFEGFVEYYYSITSVVPSHHARAYTRGLLAGEQRAQAWLEDWEAAAGGSLAPAVHAVSPPAGDPPGEESRGALVEVGCGTAPLLVAGSDYAPRVGVDIALRWLVVAKKRLARAGLDVPLIAACAEALPFRGSLFDCAVADSALEHVRDQARVLGELRRVLRPGGRLFVATPNRFSIGPDPQTGVWCGSWMPDTWTAAIVRRQGGIPPLRRLLSAAGLRRLLRVSGFTDIRVFLPRIPAALRAGLSPALRQVVNVYEAALRLPMSRQALRGIGPLLHAVARKPAAP
jgi:SAM-dependent methyltransferase/uncharacterized protein YbaR (Trm112 family)